MTAYTAPRTWVAGETVTAALCNTHIRDNFQHIAGTLGFTGTPSATRGIEPTSTFFMGAAAANQHIEKGTAVRSGALVSITFANAFASNPVVVCVPTINVGSWWVEAISTTGADLNASTDCTLNWIALGGD